MMAAALLWALEAAHVEQYGMFEGSAAGDKHVFIFLIPVHSSSQIIEPVLTWVTYQASHNEQRLLAEQKAATFSHTEHFIKG